MEKQDKLKTEEQRKKEMEERYAKNQEKIIELLMKEQGLTREQALARFRWPL
jgi:hypothetical protein